MARDHMDPSDAELAALAKAGDRAAFGRLVERHYDFIHRVAWKWCGRRVDAEDIAQDVCVRLARAIGSFAGQGAFTTWLYALTLNVARDHRRKDLRETRKVEAFGAEPAPGAAEDGEEASAALWAAVRLLPDKQRTAVLLVYGEELGHAAAAEVMDCAEATVSWHVHEARKRLRVLMRQQDAAVKEA